MTRFDDTPRNGAKHRDRQGRRSPRATRSRLDAAAEPLAALAAQGAAAYRRERHLARLLPLWPKEVADTSAAGTMRIIVRLRDALRAERRRGRAGHWTYDLNRHMALTIALKAETAFLGRTETGSPRDGPP